MTTWLDQNGEQLLDGMDRISIENNELRGDDVVGRTIESRLTITAVVPDSDHGNYSCNATNGFGDDIFMIELTGESKCSPKVL